MCVQGIMERILKVSYKKTLKSAMKLTVQSVLYATHMGIVSSLLIGVVRGLAMGRLKSVYKGSTAVTSAVIVILVFVGVWIISVYSTDWDDPYHVTCEDNYMGVKNKSCEEAFHSLIRTIDGLSRAELCRRPVVRQMCCAFCSGHVTNTRCPTGWLASDTSCYLFPRNRRSSFTEAEHYCRQHHSSHLVHIETEEENQFIRDYLRGLNAEPHWLGLTDETTEGIWVWFTSGARATWTDWGPGHPSATWMDKDCAVFNHTLDYRWTDNNCIEKFAPVCEITYTF